jgi:hypothetical protein
VAERVQVEARSGNVHPELFGDLYRVDRTIVLAYEAKYPFALAFSWDAISPVASDVDAVVHSRSSGR